MAKKPTTPNLRVVPNTGAGPGFAPPDDLKKLAFDKLASSGITPEEANSLGIAAYSAAESLAMGHEALPILKLPYFGPDNSRMPLRPSADWPDFYRVRYLRAPEPLPPGWGKYSQPALTGVAAYFPRTVDWDELRADWRQPLWITEGELKACCATLRGHPTIGLGGVWSFKAQGRGFSFLPELEVFTWARRPVCVIFDSDVMDPKKPQIRAALQALGEELCERGAIPTFMVLPPIQDTAKTGLDDFIVHRSIEELLLEKERHEVFFTAAKPLFELNDQFAFVQEPYSIARIGSPTPIKVDNLKGYATARYTKRGFTPSGAVSHTKIMASEEWIKWPLRTEVARITYAPGKAPLAVLPEDNAYNVWPGWGCEPKPGDVSPFIKLVDHVFTGATPEAKRWFMQWCAYPIKHPGTKLFSSVVLHGLEQGTGKSLLGYSLRAIYGKNFAEISQNDLHGGFNEWAAGKQLVMGDDVTGSDKRQDLDMLKKMITQLELRINVKFVPSYVIPDTVNYLWTSNHPNAFFLENKDRRFFVHEVTAKPVTDAPTLGIGWGADYMKWLGGKGGSALHAYLRDLDLTGFDPAAPAMLTDAKVRMTQHARGDLDNWATDMMADPDNMLMIGQVPMPGDLFTCRALLDAYQRFAGEEASQIKSRGMALALGRVGCRQVLGGRVVRIPGQPNDRYYCVRNYQRWEKASLEEVQEHIRDPAPSSSTPKTKPGKKKY